MHQDVVGKRGAVLPQCTVDDRQLLGCLPLRFGDGFWHLSAVNGLSGEVDRLRPTLCGLEVALELPAARYCASSIMPRAWRSAKGSSRVERMTISLPPISMGSSTSKGATCALRRRSVALRSCALGS
jgi:hypothetical protein